MPTLSIRTQVTIRDANRCRYCGRLAAPDERLTFDHVLPRSRGGSGAFSNLVLACEPCNLLKGCRTPEEAGMPLLPTHGILAAEAALRRVEKRRRHEAERRTRNDLLRAHAARLREQMVPAGIVRPAERSNG